MVGTTATDKADGDHEVEAAKVEIVDTVAYEGLTPGIEYAMTGCIMDKETGKELEGVTATATFTPDKESGQVELVFSFDASKLAGHDLVVFEALTQGEAEIAKHEDLSDKGQTVHVKEPEKPEAPTTPKITPGLPKTGDVSVPGAVFAGICLVAAAAIAGAWRLRTREEAEFSISCGRPRGGDEL